MTKPSQREPRNSRGRAIRITKKSGIKKICIICGSTEELDLDHKDDNSLNNDLKNLQYLCKPCHMTKHHRYDRKDFERCKTCKKIRLCAHSPINKMLMCTSCFDKQCKATKIDRFRIHEKYGNEELFMLFLHDKGKFSRLRKRDS